MSVPTRWALPALALLAYLVTPGFKCEQRDPDGSLLMPSSGRLEVTAVDADGLGVSGVRVLVDGSPAGRTPLTLSLSPGRYAVAVDTSGFVSAPADTLVDLESEATVAATFRLEAGFPRRVLVEEFTNSGCEGCPEFEEALVGISDDLDDADVIILGLHTNIPDPDDPMLDANALELLRRSRIFYGIGGNPSAAISGTLLPGIPPNEEAVRDSIAAARRGASPVDLELSVSVNGTDVVGEITVRAIADVPGDLRLLLMTVQSEIAYDSPPGANGQQVFRHVVRDLAPSEDGETITITAGMDTVRMLTATLFTDAVPPDDVARLECVAVLQDWSTRRIVQAAYAGTSGRWTAGLHEGR